MPVKSAKSNPGLNRGISENRDSDQGYQNPLITLTKHRTNEELSGGPSWPGRASRQISGGMRNSEWRESNENVLFSASEKLSQIWSYLKLVHRQQI
jgi:hypothetical protein